MKGNIRSTWFEEALKEPKLKKAIQRLRFADGDFFYQESLVRAKLHSPKTVRIFYAEGPRGGISGILLARKRWDDSHRKLGIFVDRKNRRQNLATSLVMAARFYYPSCRMRGIGWDDRSSRFWKKVKPITDHPASYWK